MKKRLHKLPLVFMGTIALGVIEITPLAYIQAEDKKYEIQYIEDENTQYEDSSNSNAQSEGDKTQDEINQAEGIAAEQIVVKITQDGYVTSHGDHYHYYNGEVSENSIISEDLMAPEDYVFNDQDIISKVTDGSIIKYQDKYYVYVENIDQAKNIRSIEEIVLQSNGVLPTEAKSIVDLKKEYELGEESLVIYEGEKTPKQISEDEKLNGEHIVVYLTENEYVTCYGIDLHVFKGQVPEDMAFSEKILAPKEYKFNDTDVIYEMNVGQIIKYQDRIYLYLKDKNNTKNIRNSNDISKQIDKWAQEFKENGSVRKNNNIKPGEIIGGSGSRNASGSYVTDDGYVFSPYDVVSDTGDGVIVAHGDHFHFIPKGDLTASEIKAVNNILGKNTQGSGKKKDKKNDNIVYEPANESNVNQKNGRYTTSDGYVFTPESITKVDGMGFIAKHGSHYHWVPFKDLNAKELEQAK